MHKHSLTFFLTVLSLDALASTTNTSLSGTLRDAFDNVNENPALVVREDKKTLARIGKGGQAQLLTTVGRFGLGIQANTLSSNPVIPEGVNNQDFTAGMTALSTEGMPLQITLGGVEGSTTWGSSLQYENSKVKGVDGTNRFEPGFTKLGLRLGAALKELQAALGYTRDDWYLATSSSINTATGQSSTPLPSGLSDETANSWNALVRFKLPLVHAFASYDYDFITAKVWNSETKQKTTRKNLNVNHTLKLGGEKTDALMDGLTLHNQAWFQWKKDSINLSQRKEERSDLSLNSAHGIEYSAAPWVSLRAGVRSTLWAGSETTLTTYAADNQSGAMVVNTTKSTHTLRTVPAPTMGLGFKFGRLSIDTTLSQNGTENIGFTNDFLGQVEVTAQF